MADRLSFGHPTAELCYVGPDDDLIKLDLLLSTDPAIDSERDRDLRFKFFFSGGSCEFKSSCSFLGFGFGLVGLVLMDGNIFSNSDESVIMEKIKGNLLQFEKKKLFFPFFLKLKKN